jgi:hypothetical protein
VVINISTNSNSMIKAEEHIKDGMRWILVRRNTLSTVLGVLIAVHCRAGYVCPASLACVPTPADCPCPYPYVSYLPPAESMYADECSEDIKCVIPDTRARDEGEGPPFVCVRRSCEEVVRLSKPI